MKDTTNRINKRLDDSEKISLTSITDNGKWLEVMLQRKTRARL